MQLQVRVIDKSGKYCIIKERGKSSSSSSSSSSSLIVSFTYPIKLKWTYFDSKRYSSARWHQDTSCYLHVALAVPRFAVSMLRFFSDEWETRIDWLPPFSPCRFVRCEQSSEGWRGSRHAGFYWWKHSFGYFWTVSETWTNTVRKNWYQTQFWPFVNSCKSCRW